MEWLIIGVTGAAITVVLLRAKRKQSPPVIGRLNFDSYKADELDQRGLLDRTKWRCSLGLSPASARVSSC